jgi:predicted nucleotidyltransferase
MSAAAGTSGIRPNLGRFRTEDEALAALVDDLVSELDPDEIWLFGSRARGTARPDSDFDLLVVAKAGQDWADDYDRAYRATRRAGVGCDVIPVGRADFDEAATLHTSFVSAIREEGRKLYEARP